ncbi:f-actin-capping protein subunit beta-like protein [Neocallimastix californiae]|uniref:F-actin-capping protein subunit beta n=1 Tax=Neocallimastix californiae TaxID=1754190 RepID=A0A1Y2AZ19_9FUNG|nr:f-actin-capping protein subunit beta-like protein [Neocallimastix californiae]|eukprot:ORY27540.1 f-actin-capping protein subunit beta-like protein [Neocallimastix californiae]
MDLMRRLPPQNIEINVANLIDLCQDDEEDFDDFTGDLLSSIHQPLIVKVCPETNREYLASDYNRDLDSYRSPWSNNFDPPLQDATYPSDQLRKLEVQANEAFDVYRDLYYGGGLSSVYMWDTENGFAAAVFLKKTNEKNATDKSSWDSIHIFEVENKGRNVLYKLTSTITLYIVSSNKDMGNMNLSGSLTRYTESEFSNQEHIGNLGRMVEGMEFNMRNTLQEIYFGKTRNIVNELRSIASLQDEKKKMLFTKDLMNRLKKN